MAANLTGCNLTSADEASTTADAVSIAVSIVLVVAGAAVLALSMVMQRYGLSASERTVKACGCRWHWFLMYFLGLCLYGVANGLKITGYNLGPITVLGSIFSSTLVFNLFFARYMLREEITMPKILSSVVIIAGAVLCTIGAPFAGDVKTVFSPNDISALMATHVPFCVVCLLLLGTSFALVVYYERAFPVSNAAKDAAAAAAIKDGEGATTTLRAPPRWLDALMAIVYPGGLGVVEALADLLIRAWTAMLGVCAGGRACADCNTPIVYVSIALWVLLSFGGSLIVMPVVYKRFEVSVALPIEYGSVNAGTVLVGLLFYDEHQFMRPWQLALQVIGCIVILVGIGLGRLPAKAGAPAGATLESRSA